MGTVGLVAEGDLVVGASALEDLVQILQLDADLVGLVSPVVSIETISI